MTMNDGIRMASLEALLSEDLRLRQKQRRRQGMLQLRKVGYRASSQKSQTSNSNTTIRPRTKNAGNECSKKTLSPKDCWSSSGTNGNFTGTDEWAVCELP